MHLCFRPIEEEDLVFLKDLYASTRTAEMNLIVDWSDDQKIEFLNQQFWAQHKFYQEQFKDAEFNLITHESVAIGRLYVEVRSDEVRIIDIALISQFRNKGYGKSLMLGVMERGRILKLPVRIHVEQNNPAMHLYDRLGFRKIGDNGIYFLMEWKSEIK